VIATPSERTRPLPLHLIGLAALYVVSLGAFSVSLARSTAWVNPDNYGYLAWGAQVARGVQISVDNALATPHPLPIAFAAIVGRMGTPLAIWTTVALISIALISAASGYAAFRRAGIAAAALAIVMVAASDGLAEAVDGRTIDVVSTAAITVAIAVPRQRLVLRVLLISLAGLIRPEPWVLAGALAFCDYAGPLWKRLGAGALAGAVAPVTWMTFDGIFAHDPLLAIHRTDALTGIARRLTPIQDAPRVMFDVVEYIAGRPAVALGGAAMVYAVYRLVRYRRRPDDFLPLLIVVTIPLALMAEIGSHGYPLRTRYLLPAGPALMIEGAVAVVALGRWASARGSTSRFWLRAAFIGLVALNLALAATRPGGGHTTSEEQTAGGVALVNAHMKDCRKILMLGGDVRDVKLIAPIAIATDTPLERFVWIPTTSEALPGKAPPPRVGDAALTVRSWMYFPPGMKVYAGTAPWRGAVQAGGCRPG
jgi:hypothetical protein